jgi:CBS-domain-containing membrane protein
LNEKKKRVGLTFSLYQTDSLFFQQSLEDAIEQTSPSERLVTVQASDALLDVIALLTRQNTHQVLVTNEQRQPPILLSQMDLLRYLQAHNHHLGPILDLTVPRLVQLDSQQARPTFNTATYKITAFSAFQQLARDAGIGALPIVDDEGYLVNDLGPQDLQGIDKSRFQELKKPILMFLKSNRRDLVVTPFTCHERFTLSQIMSALVLGKTSRLWWIGQDGHIKDVITPTNALCAFITLH